MLRHLWTQNRAGLGGRHQFLANGFEWLDRGNNGWEADVGGDGKSEREPARGSGVIYGEKNFKETTNEC